MTLSVSAPVRIAAICGLVFTVLVFGGLRLLGAGGGSDTTATPHVIRHHAFGTGVTKTAHKAAPAAKPAVAPKAHKATPATKAKPKAIVRMAK